MNKKLIAIGIIFVFLIISFSGCTYNDEDSDYSDDWSIAKSYLKNQFNYPSSVDATAYKYANYEGGHSFSGDGTAQNAFGAKIGFTFWIKVINGEVVDCDIDVEGI